MNKGYDTHTQHHTMEYDLAIKKKYYLQQHGWAVKSFSYVRFFATPWTVAYYAPPSMGFSKKEYWSGLKLIKNIIRYLLFIAALFSIAKTWKQSKCLSTNEWIKNIWHI